MTPDQAAKLRREINYTLDDIVKRERDILYLEGLISRDKYEIRLKQIQLWRHEQSIEESVSNDEIEADLPFRIRFPNHEAI